LNDPAFGFGASLIVMKKVLITGLNIISSLGLNLAENWANLVAGKCGVSRIALFDPSNIDTRIAAQLPDGFEEYAAQYIKKRTAQQMTRVTRMAFACAAEAVINGGFDFARFDRTRCAVIFGAVSTGNSSVERIVSTKNKIIKSMSNAIPAWLSMHYGLEGPNFTVNTACASSSYAMGLGYDMIRSGAADLVITGGADSTVNPEEIEGFNELYALSTRNDEPEKACRPFTKNRDGFVIGEGAGIVILESEESAKSRNADIFAEMAGYALTSEAYNIMAPQKDGAGMARTMQLALEKSGVSAGDVDYINAHGTSTTLNDMYETMAIKQVFGRHAYSIPVSSSKSMIGHTIAAAGAIEASITALSLRYQLLTPTINYDLPDPELDLDYVPNKSRPHKINVALSNSFAFGGHNATVVLRKY
jgi:3-oxoacyl-[acyl-carrier-protein] synthase II